MDKLEFLSFLIKPSSSMCNLNCSYCFYNDVSKNRNIKNYGFISKNTTKNLIHKAMNSVKESGRIFFNFQGGEPLMIGLEYYEFFVSEVEKYKGDREVNYAIQSNGTLINEEWAIFFKEHSFLVGISLDGFEENHNRYRFNFNNEGQFKNTMKAIDILKKYDIDFNILTVLTNELSKFPDKLYDFYAENNFEYVQLIPCLPDLNVKEDTNGLSPRNFSSFYKRFFDRFYEDENRFNITLFNDVFPMLFGIYPLTCGVLGNCSIQFVIEGDGGVYPCDFYVLDKYRLGNINEIGRASCRERV